MGVTGRLSHEPKIMSPTSGQWSGLNVGDVCYDRRMTVTYLPTPAEHDAITRATAHAAEPATLAPDARWIGRGVNDTEAARVMRALECGVPIIRTGNARWYAPAGSPLNGRSVSVVVNEMIRVGLLVNVPYGALIPAVVHLKGWNEAAGAARAACGISEEGKGSIRTRLVISRRLVDCRACREGMGL